jgi:hypothetical protein
MPVRKSTPQRERRTRKSASVGKTGRAVPQSLARAARFFSTALSSLLLLGVALGLTAGRPEILRRAGIARAHPLHVEFNWPPLAGPAQLPPGQPNTWLNAKTRAELEHLVQTTVSADPFDARSLLKAQKALMETGWFASPCRLERGAAGLLRVRCNWRIPAAAVRCADVDHLVTSHGELLDFVCDPDASGLRIILGPHMDPPECGEPWIGGDVQAGLSLLDYLRGVPGYDQVYAVDVSEFSTNKRLVLISDERNRILWGGRPGEFSPGQARDEVKRQRLTRLYRENGRIDAGMEFLDISLASGY